MGITNEHDVVMELRLERGLKYRDGDRKIHIVEIVEDHVVYKWWSKRKQYWRYYVDSIYLVERLIKQGTWVFAPRG